jgi:mRNA-degrading endonuclease toxin of MazEF toxin-antitoxin module
VVARGEIWWYEPPDEQPRPHLILTRDEGIPLLTQILAVPATRTVRRIPTEVELDGSDGMPVHCALAFDNVRVVRKAYLSRRQTVLSPEKLAAACAALRFATAC